VLFGTGWAVAGACPGPVAAQLGQGVTWSLFTVTGVVLGIVVALRTEPRADLLIEGKLNRCHVVGKLRLRSGDLAETDRGLGIEEVLEHHHRVVALLDRLVVEETSEPGERLALVVSRHGHILVRR